MQVILRLNNHHYVVDDHFGQGRSVRFYENIISLRLSADILFLDCNLFYLF